MPSEREIKKLYVNGKTICIEFFFCLLKIFQHPLPRVMILRGFIPQKRFGGAAPHQNRKYVHICIACQFTVKYAHSVLDY